MISSKEYLFSGKGLIIYVSNYLTLLLDPFGSLHVYYFYSRNYSNEISFEFNWEKGYSP